MVIVDLNVCMKYTLWITKIYSQYYINNWPTITTVNNYHTIVQHYCSHTCHTSFFSNNENCSILYLTITEVHYIQYDKPLYCLACYCTVYTVMYSFREISILIICELINCYQVIFLPAYFSKRKSILNVLFSVAC